MHARTLPDFLRFDWLSSTPPTTVPKPPDSYPSYLPPRKSCIQPKSNTNGFDIPGSMEQNTKSWSAAARFVTAPSHQGYQSISKFGNDNVLVAEAAMNQHQ
eukprot:scaffold7221_cov165-Amphora_coffeaeformis.AAC.13